MRGRLNEEYNCEMRLTRPTEHRSRYYNLCHDACYSPFVGYSFSFETLANNKGFLTKSSSVAKVTLSISAISSDVAPPSIDLPMTIDEISLVSNSPPTCAVKGSSPVNFMKGVKGRPLSVCLTLSPVWARTLQILIWSEPRRVGVSLVLEEGRVSEEVAEKGSMSSTMTAHCANETVRSSCGCALTGSTTSFVRGISSCAGLTVMEGIVAESNGVSRSQLLSRFKIAGTLGSTVVATDCGPSSGVFKAISGDRKSIIATRHKTSSTQFSKEMPMLNWCKGEGKVNECEGALGVGWECFDKDCRLRAALKNTSKRN